jgi:hypothetical protein
VSRGEVEVVNHELICGWLGLPAGAWPPDHYRLLGLSPGEGDPGVIERHVHERLDAIRRYQVTHPDQATEAMNRLAQAFICLTEAGAKSAYDAALFGTPAPATKVNLGPTPPPLPALPAPTPPPLPAPTPSPSTATLPLSKSRGQPILRAAPAPSGPRLDPIREAALDPAGRKGLATIWGVVRRARRTRRLLIAWEALGEYLESARRKIDWEAEEDDFVARYEEVRRLLRGFPKILGRAGQPGHLVLAQAGPDVADNFRHLRLSVRLTLSNDWLAGKRLLEAYRDFLLDELKTLRRLRRGERVRRAVRAFFTDQPGFVLLLAGLLALNVAVWGGYAFRWWWR